MDIFVVGVKEERSTQITISRADPKYLKFKPIEGNEQVESFLSLPKDMAVAIAKKIMEETGE